jgi:hypothetical protein
MRSRQTRCAVTVTSLVLASKALGVTPPAPPFRAEPTAQAQFTLIAGGPWRIQERRALSDMYRALGHESVAIFYQRTARLLEGDDVRYDRREGASKWSCPESPREAQSLRGIARDTSVAVLRHASDGEGLRAAQESLRIYGYQCPITSEWARAVLLAARGGSVDLPTDSRERAIRSLIILADELNVWPVGLEGSAAAYRFLADYFVYVHDYPSAYVAARTAESAFRAGSATGNEDRESFKRTLTELLGVLNGIIRERPAH